MPPSGPPDAPASPALFPREHATQALVDRLTAHALARGLAGAGVEPDAAAADELMMIARGDDLALVLALQRVRRGERSSPGSAVLERAGRILHLALARRVARSST
jgi:hypothetical protein